MAGTYGIDTDANQIYSLMLAATPITVNTIDLTANIYNVPSDVNSPSYQQIDKLTNADYTSGAVDGTGIFDVMMQGMKAQLQEEFTKGRITGAEYTKAYMAMMQVAAQNSTQYLLGRDQAYWGAVTAQVDAVTKRVELEIAKYQATLARIQAENEKATLALTKAKLGTEDAQYGQLKYQIDNLLPAQLLQLQAQTAQLNSQKTVTDKQLLLIQEQVETARAQTLDVRSDGQAVSGSVGSQKLLYAQQIKSYQRDAEVKAAKLFTDAWNTQKTIDDGVVPPDAFANPSLNGILTVIKANNNLG